MKLKVQLSLCIAGSAVLTIITLIFTTVFAEEKSWFSFGPSSHLSIAGVVIDTQQKYSVLVVSIVFNSVIDMLVSEFAQPILGFNIYNPDKKVITDFKSKRELQVLATLYWSFNNVRTIFTNLVSITQVDLALIKWVVLEITAIYTINIILSKKRFVEYFEDDLEMV
jgi:hypothetical protein